MICAGGAILDEMRVIWISCLAALAATAAELEYAPAPVDNPLKGLVPYVGASGKDQFPHAMEFRYFSMRELMTGRGRYDWAPLERTLEEVAGRGKQLVFRVYTEYPGKECGLPEFLRKEGVKLTRWRSGDPSGGGDVMTPDYEDPRFRSAVKEFVAALGARYDGDPRVGFLTAGFLGLWGEWHDYPREDLWASEEVQAEVMTALERAFTKTKVLLRYPAGDDTWKKAPNAKRRFGYHDDSFAWATLETGKEKDSWFFLPAMKAAGAEDKWKRFPIGGELRPELWKRSFTDSPHPQGQDFAECVKQTHVTWLMDSSLFDLRDKLGSERRARALKEVSRMGYELHVSQVRIADGELVVVIENRGVAPFYYDWPVELRFAVAGGEPEVVFPKWKLSEVLPGKPVEWRVAVPKWGGGVLRIRVPNVMEGGKSLRFANGEQEGDWLAVRL